MDTPVLADQQRCIYQLCLDTGCSQEDLSGVMDDESERKSEDYCVQLVDDAFERFLVLLRVNK